MAKANNNDTQKLDTDPQLPAFTVKEGSAMVPPIVNDPTVMVTTSDSASDVMTPDVNLGGFKAETPPEVVAKSFASNVEDLLNHAVKESIPATGQPATDHHSRFAKWANALGDLWREVKQHAV